jgi:hypothetical protein
MSLFIQFFYPLSSFILFVGEEHQQRRGRGFVGDEHQQRRGNMLCLCSLNLFICYPTSFCLLVKNTNKGEGFANGGCLVVEQMLRMIATG